MKLENKELAAKDEASAPYAGAARAQATPKF
jgi:hypothetical protein